MSKRMAFWLAWSVWLLCLGMVIATLFSQIRQEPAGWFGELFDTLVLLAFATVGALIASHRPEHPIGWLFCASTLLWTLGVVLVEYTVSDFLANPAVSPLEALAGAIGLWARAMGWYMMLTYLLLFFPNGHLPSVLST
ncbi:hypothetical protein [Ktedonobacter racemifer]|uniref:Uncharacterized protein n=1 Tax=Ktedonobacter racemifer DSM 44963 TaxID=485913 RepID=D6U1D9_KTERA|nr:hypothetical protein [Ktedonobacter racemifer]EFH80790.1 hypothetical protein Krac_1412 [Ktedonobacter racemifer DSM 44963]